MHTKHTYPSLWVTFIGIAAISLLSGCNDDTAKSSPVSTQVAATVNGKEITIHRVNQVLSQLPRQPDKAGVQQILDRLIVQELLAQKSIEQQLDRNGKTISAIDMAKQSILADAYTQQLLQSIEVPSERELQAYYDNNPANFGERMIVSYSQFLLNQPKGDINELLDKVATYEQLLSTLKLNGINYQVTHEMIGSERLGVDKTNMFKQLNDQDIGIVKLAQGDVAVFFLHNKFNEPISFNQAKAAIQNYLTEQKRTETLTSIINQLKANARIEKLGEFNVAP
jgi:EpsD family peptidyl-prolyl cis-trans isomerase